MSSWRDDYGNLFNGALVNYIYHNYPSHFTVCPGWPVERCIYLIQQDGTKVASIDISKTPLRRLLDG